MSKKLIFIVFICLVISAFISSCGKTDKKSTGAVDVTEKKQDLKIKPFRVLLIIGDQWTDPMSYNIDPTRVKGTDFLDVVNMLKIWGVPFDILRLDEQRLQINRFLDGEARPNYGCVIWMADPDILKGYSANYQTLKRAVEEYGISMIALFDNIRTKQVADLVGVDYKDVKEIKLYSSADQFTISGEHFITSGAKGVILPDINLHDNLNWIESRKNKHWMGFNETCAYLHTNISSPGKNGIDLYYDDHYCKYFEKKPSFWTLELSDSFKKELGNKSSVSIDGKAGTTVLESKQVVEIPAGLGIHRLQLVSRNQ